MNFEALQELWKNQPAGDVKLAAEAELLVRVKRDSGEFDAMIRQRDRRELRAGLEFAVTFGVVALAVSPDGVVWPFLAAAGGMLFIVAFFIGEKRLAAERKGKSDGTLLGELTAARTHVRRQTWLLRNVAWWYLLPAQAAWWLFGLGALLNAPQVFPLGRPCWTIGIALLVGWTWFLGHGAKQVYALNADAVRNDLEPRARELDVLIADWQRGENGSE